MVTFDQLAYNKRHNTKTGPSAAFARNGSTW